MGVEVDSERVEVMYKWPTPTNQNELHGFLGLMRYNHQFVGHYGDMTWHLTQHLNNE